MSTPINIQSPGLSGIAQSAGTAQGQGFGNFNLGDFLSLLLGQLAPSADPATLTPDDLSAKITALASQESTQPAALKSLLEKLNAAKEGEDALPPGLTQEDILKKIMHLLLTPATADSGIKTSLVCDMPHEDAVGAVSAGDDLAASIEDVLPAVTSDETPDNDIAALLNNIEPGSSDTQTLMDELKEKIDALDLSNSSTTLKDLNKAKEEIMALLQDKGLGREAINKYLNELRHYVDDKLNTTGETSADTSLPTNAATQAQEKVTSVSNGLHKAIGLQLHMLQDTDASVSQQDQGSAALKTDHINKPAQTSGVKQEQAPLTSPVQAPQQQQPQTNNSVTSQPGQKTSSLPISENTVNNLAHNDGKFTADDWRLLPHGLHHRHQIADHAGVIDTNNPGFGSYVNAARLGKNQMSAITLQIQKNALTKTDVMTLQLSPAELGKVEIRMTFDNDGSVKAHLIADNADTFAALQKDATNLQRTLQQAGLDIEDSGLSFDLRQQQHDLGDARDGTPKNDGFKNHANKNDLEDAEAMIKLAPFMRGTITANGVNIMV